MGSLMSWVRSRLSPSVDGIWCIHCKTRRTVREVVVVSHRQGKRMVGECHVCQGETSTFVSGQR